MDGQEAGAAKHHELARGENSVSFEYFCLLEKNMTTVIDGLLQYPVESSTVRESEKLLWTEPRGFWLLRRELLN